MTNIAFMPKSTSQKQLGLPSARPPYTIRRKASLPTEDAKAHTPLETGSTHHRINNSGSIDASKAENSYNVNTADNRVDNRMYTTTHHNYPALEHNAQPKIHFMVPFSRNKGFVGKSQTLKWVDEKIKGGEFGHHRVALWGMGGIG